MIDERDTRILLRRLCGELAPDEERRLAARLAAEPPLRAAAEELQRSWRALDLPPETAPAGLADQVMARVAGAELEAPAWVRLAAAAALAAGIALGVSIGRLPPQGELPEALGGPAEATLADSYLAAIEELRTEAGE